MFISSCGVTRCNESTLTGSIHGQRLVVEGYPTFVITDEHIKDYLSKLSEQYFRTAEIVAKGF